MSRVIDDPVRALSDWAAASDGPQRRIIGLVGLPGAGKSTWAQAWCRAVNQAAGHAVMQALGMDGFHLSRAQLAALPNAEEALARRGAEWTFDPAALRRHLQALRQPGHNGQAQPCTWPDFDHAAGDPVAAAIEVSPHSRLILVEGLYLLLPDADWALKDCFDAVWFLDVAPEQAQQQLMGRHQRVWGWNVEQAKQRAQGSDALNAARVWATRERADAWVRPEGWGA